MPNREGIIINFAVLRWARVQAGFTLLQAVTRAKIHDLKTTNVSAVERLQSWEEGLGSPTLNELRSLAKVYRRPLLTFFLPEPPESSTKLEDFRTIGDHPILTSSPEFSAFTRQIQVLQEELREIIRDEGAKPLAFVGSVNAEYSPKDIAQSIREVLDFPFSDQEKIRQKDQLFNILRSKAEDAGTFVLRKADLGSHHSNISVDEFRGLTISDEYAPLIIVNPSDAISALIFTLIHEFAHLLLGDSGISNSNIFNVSAPNRLEREILCNKVAAEFLVPENLLFEEHSILSTRDISTTIDALSDRFKVSRIVIGRRLLEYELIEDATYWQLYEEWILSWNTRRSIFSEGSKGPGYFINTKSKLGKKLLQTVLGAAYDGRLSYLNASKMLNIKVNNFNEFIAVLE